MSLVREYLFDVFFLNPLIDFLLNPPTFDGNGFGLTSSSLSLSSLSSIR